MLSPCFILFRPFLEAVEIPCFAGLLTYFRQERLPNLRTDFYQQACGNKGIIPLSFRQPPLSSSSRQWHWMLHLFYEAYSSGTVRDSHPVPF